MLEHDITLTNEDKIEPAFSRRQVLKGGSVAAASTAFMALSSKAQAASLPFSSSYGPLVPTADKATGLMLLSLPEG